MRLDLSGQRFGKLVAVERDERPNRYARWICTCDCGSQSVAAQADLLSGHSKSCGCLRNALNRTRHIKHGRTRTAAYKSWSSMKQRTCNPNNPDWHYYGGRGISLCARWMIFENFVSDMGDPPSGFTIDRIDSDGDYEPSNCRWASRQTQSANRRNVKCNLSSGTAQAV